ncbi:hypothetical protein [Roseospira navarrensis]|uniref:Uncharacterized protein n=1 Tax=Roseospira navarrensis TaxID=140058 RepID=A0A7X1ZH75_9PROT|nr:hypothetical protein [Roseospira navarrensis]MQX38489.1 hypothetical protein [Roseospira navarrensis]
MKRPVRETLLLILLTIVLIVVGVGKEFILDYRNGQTGMRIKVAELMEDLDTTQATVLGLTATLGDFGETLRGAADSQSSESRYVAEDLRALNASVQASGDDLKEIQAYLKLRHRTDVAADQALRERARDLALMYAFAPPLNPDASERLQSLLYQRKMDSILKDWPSVEPRAYLPPADLDLTPDSAPAAPPE